MGTPEGFPANDVLLASAVNYLLQGDEREVAAAVLASAVSIRVQAYDEPVKNWEDGMYYSGDVAIQITGSRKSYEMFRNTNLNTYAQLYNAFRVFLPDGYDIRITAKMQPIEALTPDWHTEMQALATGQTVSNQGVEIPNRESMMWRGLRFRSQAEVRIAAALDAIGVLFLPNCLARLGPKDTQNPQATDAPQRFTKEADFLICSNGKWGVLEVDGSQHEGAAAKDHERDRLFQFHGIRVTQRFTAKECYNDAPGVVRHFLTLLAKNG